MKKVWLIFTDEGGIIGRLNEDDADDERDAVLNWADEHLHAQLMKEEDTP